MGSEDQLHMSHLQSRAPLPSEPHTAHQSFQYRVFSSLQNATHSGTTINLADSALRHGGGNYCLACPGCSHAEKCISDMKRSAKPRPPVEGKVHTTAVTKRDEGRGGVAAKARPKGIVQFQREGADALQNNMRNFGKVKENHSRTGPWQVDQNSALRRSEGANSNECETKL